MHQVRKHRIGQHGRPQPSEECGERSSVARLHQRLHHTLHLLQVCWAGGWMVRGRTARGDAATRGWRRVYELLLLLLLR